MGSIVRRSTALTAGLIFAGASLAALAQGYGDRQGFGDRREGGLIIFTDPDFRGRSARITGDTPDLRGTGFDNTISSIRVPPGERWELCDGRGFTGRCEIFDRDEPNLAWHGWSDVTSSIRRLPAGFDRSRDFGRPGFPDRDYGPPQPLRGGELQLFSGPDFSGRPVVLRGPTPDFREFGFNDRALSLHTVHGEAWEVCVNIKFDDCRVVDGDWGNLSRIGLGRGISSARPHVRPRGPGRGNIMLFAGTDFSGESIQTGPMNSLVRRAFNDRALSALVAPGDAWEICVDADFNNCRIIDRDIPDLGPMGLGRNISSVRRAGGR